MVPDVFIVPLIDASLKAFLRSRKPFRKRVPNDYGGNQCSAGYAHGLYLFAIEHNQVNNEHKLKTISSRNHQKYDTRCNKYPDLRHKEAISTRHQYSLTNGTNFPGYYHPLVKDRDASGNAPQRSGGGGLGELNDTKLSSIVTRPFVQRDGQGHANVVTAPFRAFAVLPHRGYSAAISRQIALPSWVA